MMSTSEICEFELNYESPQGMPCLVPAVKLEQRLDWRLRFPSNPGIVEEELPRFAIHLHAFHVEGLGILLRTLAAACTGADLLITTDTNDKEQSIVAFMQDLDLCQCFASYKINIMLNRGRNVWPLLQYAYQELYDHQVVLHLHTKRSTHTDYGQKWFADTLKSLSLIHI